MKFTERAIEIAIIISIMILMILWSAWFKDAFGQDTSLVADGVYTIHQRDNKFVAVIGDFSVYRGNDGSIMRGKWNPKREISGIFEEVIREDMITRASKQAPSYKVSHGSDYIQFVYEGGMAASDSFTQQRNGWRWKFAEKTIFEVTTSRGRVKELITSYGKNTFSWTLDGNNEFMEDGNGIRSGSFLIEKPVAADRGGKNLNTQFGLMWTDKWILSLTVDTAGAKFPIVIDPSVIISSSKTWAGLISRNDESSWANARDAAAGELNTITGVYVNVNSNASTWTMYRGSFKFSFDSLPGGVYEVTACTLKINGQADGSATNFTISTASAFNDTIDNAAYIEFHGRNTAAAHNYKTLTYPINTTSFGGGFDTTWYNFVFTPYALDTAETKLNASAGSRNLIFHMIGSHDSANTSTGTQAFVQFDGSNTATPPYLVIDVVSLPAAPSQQSYGRSLGRILHEAPGYELDPERNPGKVINEVWRK